MGKKWDYDVPTVEVWKECLRVLKPGGHLLSFSSARTYHRMVVNVEDAGFEIRDQIMWVYGSGFPKNHNVGDGKGTALKPAHEPIVMARKPISEKNIKANVLKWGTGAINIDKSRNGDRFPANFIHDGLDTDWSHYFYCPKVSKKERNEGMPEPVGVFSQRPRRADGSVIYKETHPDEWKEAMDKLPRKDSTSKAAAEEKLQTSNGGLSNNHPTVNQ